MAGVQSSLKQFNQLSLLVKGFTFLFSHPLLSLPERFRDSFLKKLISTIHAYGHSTLADGIITHNYEAQLTNENKIMTALRNFTLYSTNRMEISTRYWRLLLRELCQYCHEENVIILERMWREVMACYIQDDCVSPLIEEYIYSSSIVFDSNKAKEIISSLLNILSKIREMSHVDMSITKISGISADLAFEMAFRRLQKDHSIAITKIIVVYLSSIIDSLKSPYSSADWQSSLDDVIDLIQVVFNQSSTEFQHYYELLLARRLLKGRYISLNTELRMLDLIPISNKCQLMVKDISLSAQYTDHFRSYLMEKIDYGNLVLSDDNVDLCLLPNRFMINVLTSSSWPPYLLSPNTYATLKLPNELEEIKFEYLNYYLSQNTDQSGNSSITALAVKGTNNQRILQSSSLSSSDKAYEVFGSEENASKINGTFLPTGEMKDGWPIYEMRENNNCILEYSLGKNSWQIKKRADKGRDVGWAYCKVSAGESPVGDNRNWLVWKRNQKKWIPQPIKVKEEVVSAVSFAGSGSSRSGLLYSAFLGVKQFNSLRATNPYHDDSIANMAKKSLKRIYWCHDAGTMTLSAIWPKETEKLAFIRLSEAQGAVLLCFNFSDTYRENEDIKLTDLSDDIDTQSLVITFSNLRKLLNITPTELAQLLYPLMGGETPILELSRQPSTNHWIEQQLSGELLHEASHSHLTEDTVQVLYNFQESDEIQLSAIFRSGILGGNEENFPIIVSSSHSTDVQVINSDFAVLQGWRNEQIDACVVRVLKDALVQKSGDLSSPPSSKYPSADLICLSVDTLSYKVRNVLLSFYSNITQEEVVKRCERLVSIGIIEKNLGNIETFRSVSYSYLSDLSMISTTTDENNITTLNNLIEYHPDQRMTGVELYDHLRIVLNVKYLLSNQSITGITFSPFYIKLLNWLMEAKCDLPSHDINLCEAHPLFALLKGNFCGGMSNGREQATEELHLRHNPVNMITFMIPTLISSMQEQLYALIFQSWLEFYQTNPHHSHSSLGSGFSSLQYFNKHPVHKINFWKDYLKRLQEEFDPTLQKLEVSRFYQDCFKLFVSFLPSELLKEIIIFFLDHIENQDTSQIREVRAEINDLLAPPPGNAAPIKGENTEVDRSNDTVNGTNEDCELNFFYYKFSHSTSSSSIPKETEYVLDVSSLRKSLIAALDKLWNHTALFSEQNFSEISVEKQAIDDVIIQEDGTQDRHFPNPKGGNFDGGDGSSLLRRPFPILNSPDVGIPIRTSFLNIHRLAGNDETTDSILPPLPPSMNDAARERDHTVGHGSPGVNLFLRTLRNVRTTPNRASSIENELFGDSTSPRYRSAASSKNATPNRIVTASPAPNIHPIKVSFPQYLAIIFRQAVLTSAQQKDTYFNELFSSSGVNKLSEIIHYLFFIKFSDIISKMFNIKFSYVNDDLSKYEERNPTDEEIMPDAPFEEMIPCEFCTDSIPVSRFEAHVILCRTGRLPLLGGNNAADNINPDPLQDNIVATARIVNRANQAVEAMFRHLNGRESSALSNRENDRNKLTEKQITKVRPQSNSPLVAIFIEKLINLFLEFFSSHQSLFLPSKDMLKETKSEKDQSFSRDKDVEEVKIPATFHEFTLYIFHMLDRDRNKSLNIHDFSDEDKSFAEFSSTIDPLVLYGNSKELKPHSADQNNLSGHGKVALPKRANSIFSSTKNQNISPFHSSLQRKRGSKSSTDAADLDDDEFFVHSPPHTPSASPSPQRHRLPSHSGLNNSNTSSVLFHSPSIPFQKSDSLWASVSNEKSLPIRESSRSFSHLDEMEEELLNVIQRTQDIIDDSESTAIALLLHYQWDMKTLVEEYIDNHRLLRKMIGLGVRNKPSFYRLDRYIEECGSKEEIITIMCGICREEVESIRSFGLNCGNHWFCQDCWEGYIESAITIDHKLIIRCPSPDCNCLILNDMIRFFGSSQVITQSKKLLLK